MTRTTAPYPGGRTVTYTSSDGAGASRITKQPPVLSL